ncbi:Sensor histidine kinase RcsC [Alphaproteobacteria bacterium SO-S41]|nr:Sensor histidine kinase RcsC [Alphaproteobacteria bacterium SO-S41]
MAAEHGIQSGDPGAIDMAREVRSRRDERPAGGRAALTLSAFCLGIAFAAAILAVIYHREAGFAGLALLIGLTVAGVGVLAAIAMRRPDTGARDRRARMLASAFEGFVDPMAITKGDGTVVFANLSYREMCGGKASRILPPELAIRPDADMAGRLYRLARAASEGGAATADIRTTEGGVAHWRRVSVESMARGRADQRLNFWRFHPLADVTTREMPADGAEVVALPERVSETAPENNGDRQAAFADLFAAAPVAMALVKPDGAIDVVNASFAQFVKVESTDKLKATAFIDLIAPADRPEAERIIRLAAERADGAASAEVTFAAGGAAQIHALPVTTPDGETGSVALHVIDMTNLRSIEMQFLQAQKMQAVGKLAGGVAHDFNNILTAMNGYADLLLLRHKAGDPSFADLMQIRNSGNRAARLVRHLLAFSRQQTLTPKVYPASDLIADLSEILKRLLTERIKLAHDFGRDLWPVRVDQAQFDNMIINLGVNARDAMPDGGTLTLRTRNVTEAESKEQGYSILTPGDYVLIEVADTGTGIAPENIAKIFEPFFTTKEAGQGTGLGLASVYGFVKQSGGFVFPDSTLGVGTTFKIYLPRHIATAAQEAAEREAEAAKVAAPARDLTGMGTILLVEDDDSVRSLTARALEMRGYEVLKASGGEEAIDIIKAFEKRIHLMVSDVVMPGMDGPEVAKVAKTIRKDMRVIFMSGYAEDAFRKQAEMDDDVHFLSKPFPLQELAAKVKDVMSAPN